MPSISTGLANGSISVIGLPKATFGYAFDMVSIMTCNKKGAPGSCHIASTASPTFAGLLHRGGGDPVGPRDLREIRRGVAPERGLVAFPKIALLKLAHHPVATVVQDHQFQRQLVTHHRLQFLKIQLKPAVTRNHYHRAAGTGQRGADGRRQSEAHRSHPARGQEELVRIQFQGLRGPHLMLAHVGHVRRGGPRARR